MKLVGAVVYRARGWDFEPLPAYWSPKQVIIGFPHTSNMDTVMAFAGFARVGIKGHVIVKKSWFVGPMGPIMRGMGGVAVDRSAATGLVQQLANIFAQRDEFQLALVPEGTRKGVKRIKTGFWHIAKAANVPIVCWYLDNKGKKTRWLGVIEPSDDLQADLRQIKQIYAAAGFVIEGIADA